jgi:very-short-patch-repair endonuclease
MAAVVADEPSTMVLTGDGEIASSWSTVGEQLLMPLPSNPEQERIARQLAVNRGVTVQGPPGTGKTHTIANLICHLIAHGKRVLVTSHKEQPLEVLRDKLPESLRPLCVSVLGSSKGSTAQLDRSVQEIYSRAVGLDRTLARERVGERERELDRARRRLAEVRDRTRALVERETETYVIGTREFSPAELARWLAEQEPELGFIGDRIAPGVVCPLQPEEFAQLYRLVAELEPDDLIECRRLLPDASSFISGADLVSAIERLRSVRDRLADIDLGTWQGVDDLGRGGLAALAESVGRAAQELRVVENDWLSRLRDEMVRNPVSATLWRDNAKLLREGINETLTWRGELAGHVVELPSGALPTREQVAELEQLRERFADGKGVSRLRHRDLYQLCQSCAVDQEAPSTAADASLLLAAARAARRRWELVQRWNQEVGRVGGPPLDLAAAYPEDVLDRALSDVESALTWEFETWPRLWERLNDAGLAPPTRVSQRSLEAIATQVRGAADRFEEGDLADWLDRLTSYVKSGAAHPEASDLWARLESSLATHDGVAWDGTLGESRRLARLETSAIRLDELGGRLATTAPSWAAAIVSRRGAGDGSLEVIPEAWAWRQADTWLADLIASDDPAELQRRSEEETRRIQTSTVELADERAWLAVSENLTDAQRQALTSWADALRRIGKGTGKYAPRWRAVAQAAMTDAVNAVPVWIMPTYRVVESIDPLKTTPFDVVIVDESSQCDIFSLAVLGIAEKAVIVGDDRQISPQAVGRNQAPVHELIAEYVADIPGSQLFDQQESLYNVAKRTFPGVIMLKEHFRCLPEIIQFSNDLCYDGAILPLREATSPLNLGPIVTRRVTAGYREGMINHPEADALVDAIVECCADEQYAGKTMGVISMLGQEQAQIIDAALVERLGEHEIEARDLRCGDAYNFQGDERDVMFISLVATADVKNASFVKESDRQRMNVASSRARDQMWVFHSVTPDALHPDDVRGRFLRYVLDPARMSEAYGSLAERCDSDFERDVLRELTSRGFAVRVQHRVGNFRIDMVVDGMNERLAIECDGDAFHGPDRWDADRQRQAILERLGWKFFRVRASAFYRDREASLTPLWQRLVALGIRPATNSVEGA